MKTLKWIFVALTVGFVALVTITWVALERSSVIQLETTRHDSSDPDERLRLTRAWFVQLDDELLLEAGHPDNPWVRDIDQIPRLRIVDSGGSPIGPPETATSTYCTSKDSSAQGHDKIRALMRAKYGWRDRWVDALFDVSRSALVKLRRC